MDGMAVAIPHTDIEHVRKKTISIAQLNEPVEFGVMGGTDSERVAVKLCLYVGDGRSPFPVNDFAATDEVISNQQSNGTISVCNIETRNQNGRFKSFRNRN
jgi:hypothetical protein